MEHVFDLSGGHLALDFVNTVGGMRDVKPNEHLTGYDDLLAFARQAGAIDAAWAARLAAEARRHPAEAEAALGRAKALRETLFRLLLPAPDDATGATRAADLAALNAALAAALAHRRLVEDGGGTALGWEASPALDGATWPVVEAAAQLLAGEQRARVRVCGLYRERECSWLFLDRTRAGNRTWCSMKDCGNRAKARRHYARTRSDG